MLGQIETLQGMNYIDSYLQRINAVTAEDIAGVCSEYLSEDNRTVASLISDGSERDEDEGEDDETD